MTADAKPEPAAKATVIDTTPIWIAVIDGRGLARVLTGRADEAHRLADRLARLYAEHVTAGERPSDADGEVRS